MMDPIVWGSMYAMADAASQLAPSGTGREATAARIDHLERRIEKLTMLCQALWTLVRDRAGATEDDFARRVQEIDLSDGKLDGRVAASFVCDKCNRRSARRHERCLYCEAPRKGASPFDSV